MSEHTDNNKSINETLSVIRKALQEDNFDDNNEEDVLLLNQLVKEDGTIESIDNGNIKKQEIKDLLNKKLSEVFEQHFEKWIKSQYLNVDDVRRLAAEGAVEIGSHTASHSRLNHTRAKDMETEITVAHEELEQHLQLDINYFAFPFGGLRDRSFLAEYQAMRTANYYFACSGGVNQHHVPGTLLRIRVHNESETALKNLLLSQYVR